MSLLFLENPGFISHRACVRNLYPFFSCAWGWRHPPSQDIAPRTNIDLPTRAEHASFFLSVIFLLHDDQLFFSFSSSLFSSSYLQLRGKEYRLPFFFSLFLSGAVPASCSRQIGDNFRIPYFPFFTLLLFAARIEKNAPAFPSFPSQSLKVK